MKKYLNLLLVATLLVACNKTEDYSVESAIDETETKTDNIIDSYEVSIDEAQKELELLLKDLYPQTGISKNGVQKKIIKDRYTINTNTSDGLSKTTSESSSVTIHVFNFAEDQGFALMSGDRRTESLFCLTNNGYLDTTEVIDNPGFAFFLEGLEYQQAAAVSRDRKTSSSGSRTSNTSTTYGAYKNTLLTPAGGYCPVHWNQYYNNYCYTSDGKQSVTGCAPTACAQLMATYKYPSEYKGYKYDWNGMISGANRDQICKLMYQLGTKENLNVDYQEERAGAKPKLIPQTLKNFGFSNGGELVDYNTDKVINELKNGYCVLVSGYDTEIKHTKRFIGIKVKTYYTHEGGHGWLLHGALKRERTVTKKESGKTTQNTETSYYVLCNFGWGNSDYYDGYYLSGVFDACNGSTFDQSLSKSNVANYYQYEVTAVIGIRK